MKIEFERLEWEDLPSQETPINAENLNRLEKAVDELCYTSNDHEDRIEHFKAGVELTQAEYDALTEEEKMNGTTYFIKDAEGEGIIKASDAVYDNDDSGLSATNVQAAIDEMMVKSKIVLPEVPVRALTGDIIDYNDSRITADHNLIECVFANPSAITSITSPPGLVTSEGNIRLGGTCTAATTAWMVLL